jgi:Ca2+-binding RTX toxin-like protein
LSLVIADDAFQTGLVGDNDQAGTAQNSFVVRLSGLPFGFFNAAEAHGAVVDLYADLATYLEPQSDLWSIVLAEFPKDRYNNFGDRRRNGLHEGVLYGSRQQGTWQTQWIDGDGTNLHFVRELGDRPVSRNQELDIVITLVSYELDDEFETLILGGSAHLQGAGNALDNKLYGNTGNNILDGRGGDDQIWGRGGDNILYGGPGADILYGGPGNDWLIGGVGNDVLYGGPGDDILMGGPGSDRLIGGPGSDVFVLEPVRGRATIEDFELGLDFLGLANGLAFTELDFLQRAADTWIQARDSTLAILLGIEADLISRRDFVLAPAL